MSHVICHLRPSHGDSAPSAWSADMPGYDAVMANDFEDFHADAQQVCHWCCSPYEERTVGIPTRRVGDTYTTTGQFCSHACAAAHLFHEKGDTNTAWTRYQMLNDMAGQKGPVPRAPPRSALAMFGGKMSIEEFRASTGVTIVERHAPTIVEHVRLEEIPSNHLYRELYRPLDEERVNQYKVKLQRTKPLRSFYMPAA
jgi:hypothetical protein